jgi:hypothetical protein
MVRDIGRQLQSSERFWKWKDWAKSSLVLATGLWSRSDCARFEWLHSLPAGCLERSQFKGGETGCQGEIGQSSSVEKPIESHRDFEGMPEAGKSSNAICIYLL